MNASRDLDRELGSWLDARATSNPPEGLLERSLARVDDTRQRPGWLVIDRWLSPRSARLVGVSAHVGLALALMALILVLVAVALVLVGSERRLPPPIGLAENGKLAYVAGGQIVVANPDGSQLKILTTQGQLAGRPAWSRDGTRIAYTIYPASDSPERADLLVINADGGHPVVIDSDTRSLSPVSWSPDGRQITYSKAVDGIDKVFIAAADGSGVRQIGPPGQSMWAPAWSPHGNAIAFVVGWPDIVGVSVMSSDGSNSRPLTTGPIEEFDRLVWRPDGTQLLFSARESGSDNREIYLVDIDGAPGEMALTSSPSDDLNPSWSPDGNRFAYLNAVSSGAHVVVAAADGSDPRTLPGNYGFLVPEWSPDGTRLAVSDGIDPGGGRTPRVFIIDPRGREPPIVITGADFSVNGETDDQTGPSWQRSAP